MRKALFLDRDGVINRDVAYAYQAEQIEFIDGIFALCQYAQQHGFALFIITNQSGIARGFYSEDDFLQLSQWMREQFQQHGIGIDGIYFCPHHPDITGPCDCRKPNIGLFKQVFEHFNIDKKASVMIGDKQSDMLAALNAGIANRLLFQPEESSEPGNSTAVIHSLAQATNYLL